MTITTDPDVIRHLSEVSVSVEIETADMTLNIGPPSFYHHINF